MSCEQFHASIFYCLKCNFWRVKTWKMFFLLFSPSESAYFYSPCCVVACLPSVLSFIIYITVFYQYFYNTLFVVPVFALVVLLCVRLSVINNALFNIYYNLMLFIRNLIAGTEVPHTMSVYLTCSKTWKWMRNEKIFKTYLKILIEIGRCWM